MAGWMRTTVDIPDALYHELKSRAAREKRSVEELILRGLGVELRPRSQKASAPYLVSLDPFEEARNPGDR